jgi:MFS family permease
VSRRRRPSLGPAFRRLVASSAASNLADGVLQLTLPLLALERTGSASAVAGVGVALGVPWLLFALHAGALVDRLDRRVVMVVAQLGRVGLLGTLALIVAADEVTLWMLYGAAFALGVLETVFDTSAMSILPRVVDGSDLTRANGRLFAVETTMHQFVGPPVGGALMSIGVAASLGTSAACFFVAALVLAGVPGSFRATSDDVTPTGLWADIVEGTRYLWGHRLLRRLVLVGAVSNAASTGAFALLAALVVAPGPMGLSELGFGALLSLLAVGSVLGSVVVEAVEQRLGRRRLLLLCVPVNGAAIALMATAEIAVIVPVSVVLGAGLVFWNVVVVTLRQRLVPDHLLGRVNAASRMVSWGAMPVGAAIGAALVGVVDVTTVYALSGTVIMGLAFVVRGLTERELAVEDDRVPAG